MKPRVLLLSGLAAALLPLAASASDLGPVVAARMGDKPLFLWNATSYVASLVSAHNTGDAGLATLEATALGQLADKLKSVKMETAKQITLKVSYLKTGAVSPVYNAATFSDVQELLLISAPSQKLMNEANIARWEGELSKGLVPQDLSVSVLGTLPPS
jgi:hypothetical protein